MNEQNSTSEAITDDVRPLARSAARELTRAEVEAVSGGFSDGVSNFGGPGDIDYIW